ncbi:MAG: integrin alpha, partial [Planctomycetota bacterium]
MQSHAFIGAFCTKLIPALLASPVLAQLDPPFPIAPDHVRLHLFASQDGSEGLVMNLGPARDLALFGSAVAGLGDVNNDGIDDFIVSAPTDQIRVGEFGECFIIFGRDAATNPASGFGATHDALPMEPGDGVAITSASQRGSFGRSVASAGDVNGDGIPD